MNMILTSTPKNATEIVSLFNLLDILRNECEVQLDAYPASDNSSIEFLIEDITDTNKVKIADHIEEWTGVDIEISFE